MFSHLIYKTYGLSASKTTINLKHFRRVCCIICNADMVYRLQRHLIANIHFFFWFSYSEVSMIFHASSVVTTLVGNGIRYLQEDFNKTNYRALLNDPFLLNTKGKNSHVFPKYDIPGIVSFLKKTSPTHLSIDLI